MRYLYCFMAILLGVTLAGVPFLKDVNPNIISVIGWTIALLAWGSKMLIPKPFIDKAIDKGTEFVPVVGPCLKYTK